MVSFEGRSISVPFLGGSQGTDSLKLPLVPWDSAKKKMTRKTKEKLTVYLSVISWTN